jgi:hypothetical protein
MFGCEEYGLHITKKCMYKAHTDTLIELAMIYGKAV